MMKTLLVCMLFWVSGLYAQEVCEYHVSFIKTNLMVDGILNETEWQAAPLTERFVYFKDGSDVELATQARLLWSHDYLYIAFTCEDPDVWGRLTRRDDHLWNGDAVEIFCDPDGDGLNYFEIQVNPLGTLLDLMMNKAYSEGGNADFSLHLEGLSAGISVNGTLNDSSDTDTNWICEAALPFDEIGPLAPSVNCPPEPGDVWRLLLTRYDYERKGDQTVEISAWNRTGVHGFHMPSRFGRIHFNGPEAAVKHTGQLQRGSFSIEGNYPNPFNPQTDIRFQGVGAEPVEITIHDVLGREVDVLFSGVRDGGFELCWDGKDRSGISVPAGIYIVRLRSGDTVLSKKINRIL